MDPKEIGFEGVEQRKLHNEELFSVTDDRLIG